MRVIDAAAAVYDVPVRPGGIRVEPAARRPGRGLLLLHGGGTLSREDFRPFVAAAGADPLLCLIDTATEGDGKPYRLFEGFAGVRLRVFDLDAADARRTDIAAALARCDAYYFHGGDPKLLADTFRPGGRDAPALAAIRRRFASGAPVSGTSAGAMIVGPVTLCECGATSSVMALAEGKLFQAPGFALIDDVLIDAHFLARGLLGRHLVALARNRVPLGVGIDEGTAVLVPESGPWQVIGRGGVAVVTLARRGGSEFDLSLLWPGDRFDPLRRTFEMAPSRHRQPIRRHGTPIRAANIFEPGRIGKVAQELAQGDAPEAVGFAAGGIRVTFRKTAETKAYSDGARTSALHLAVEVELP